MKLEEKIKLFFEQHSLEEFKEYYYSHRPNEVIEYFNISNGVYRYIKKEYNIKPDKELVNKRRKETWGKKETSLTNFTLSKEEIYDYYITQNHTLKESIDYFNISTGKFLEYLKHYDIKKPKSISNQLSKQTKLEKYGDENYNNREKAKETCLEKYGVDNPWKDFTINKKCGDTKEKIYGSRNHWEKNHQTRIEHSGTLKQSYANQLITYRETCIERYGIDNASKTEEVKEKIKTSVENTFQERYGSSCYFTIPNAERSYHSKCSKPNEEFNQLLLDNNIIDFTREFILENKIYDFQIENNLIEINPAATHNSTWNPFGEGIDKKYHYEKSKLAKENGYRCIQVWDWDDKEKIINLLLPKQKVYARNCMIKKVEKKEAREFINKFHLQGYARDSIRYGLYYNNELVSIMTFDKPRYNKNYEYELIRYCSCFNIVGGAEKLFKHFISDNNPKSVISYCDNSKFNGNVYEKLGFHLKRTSISKHWYNMKTKKHITDNLLRQRGFDQLFNTNYGKGSSNEQLMRDHGFVEIYDSGQSVYIY